MFTVYISGLPINAKNTLNEALNMAYGEGIVAIEELGKDNLKSRVRLSVKNPNIVLVILDNVSTEICSSIENGLYSTDKFFSYTNVKDLVVFLNNKYNIDLAIPKDEEKEVSIFDEDIFEDEGNRENESQAIIEDLENRLSHEKFLVKNLTIRVSDLQKQIDDGLVGFSEDDVEKLESLKQEVLTLKDTILSLNSENGRLQKELEDQKKKEVQASENNDRANSNYSSAIKELTDLRSKYTLQSSMISDYEKKIDDLNITIDSLNTAVKELEESKGIISTTLAERSSRVSQLEVDLASKEREVVRYQKENKLLKENQVSSDDLEKAKSTIVDLQNELNDISKENDNLQKVLASERDRSKVSDLKYNDLLEKYNKDQERIKELESRVEEDNTTIATLNKNAIELQGRLQIQETSDDAIEMSEEYVRLKRELAEIKEGVFGKIASLSLPTSTQHINLLMPWTGSGITLKNVRFVFAGSTESRKGAYKCLYNDLVGANKNVNYLIVDLVSETSIDYVFQITNTVPGLDWYHKGGGIQKYLSKTVLPNVSVLSTGLKYVNDSYFLTINWVDRLKELENSGYQVMIFCGDISNLIGRILHESFANYGLSVIYAHGNVVGARALITNIRGISNSDKSIIGYFDYNKLAKRFFDIVSQTNKCKIINSINRS